MKDVASVEREIVRRLEQFTEALNDGVSVSDRFNCRKVILDLKPEPYNPERVKEARNALGVSQSVFAMFLGVSVNTIRSWEQGVKQPSTMACRFMDEIRQSPEYMRLRLSKIAKTKPRKNKAV